MAGRTLISEAVLHQWGDQGSSSVRSQLQTALKALGSAANASSAVPSEHPTLYRLLYELLWIVLQAKLSRQDVLTLFNEVNLAKSETACDMLVDLLWVVSNEVEAKEKGRERYSSSEWQTLTRLVRDLAEEEIVPAMTLKTALEGDILHHAGLLGEPAAMMKKVVRVNTKTYYTQVKFNLLREESEGFAKVLTLLHTGITKDQIAASKTDLMSLIGYFDLDANRVLDLVLDAYEMQPHNKCFVELLELFKRDSIPHVLGFKFQFYKRESSDELSTPKSLYRLAATLIDKKLLNVEALMPHLSPSMEETVEIALEKAKEQEKAAKAFGKVNLAAKAEPDPEKEKAEALEAATKQKKNEDNQVFGLVMGMLEVGSHDRAFEMIKWFKERGVDALTHKPLMMQMCDFVHRLLKDLYEPLSLNKVALTPPASSSKGASKQSTSTQVKPYIAEDNWLQPLLTILSVLGGNLHNDAFLFTKVLRIVNHHVEKVNKDAGNDEVSSLVKKLMLESFLPALSLQSCSPSTAFQLWDLLKIFSFDERYRLYQQWEELYSTNPALQLVEAQCVQGTRRVMRRLTADRAKPSARSLTHIAHSNPLVVFRTMLRQIQSYDNLIQPVVESLKFVTPFGMDVLSFVLVSELSKSRQSMKSDGTNISLWLASLANFSGSFYRKYPNVELGGLLQYLIQRLQNWESVDLVVLSELLSKMGSCITFEDISISQLEAQAGGPHLWQEQTDPKLTNRRAIPRLRDALIKRNLALPLCLLICQVRSKMEFQEDSALSHLKTLGRMFDTSQMTLSQLLQFLNGVVDPVVYTKMLPSVSELVKQYHILPELAMTICRPAIRCEDTIFKKTPRSIHSSSSASSDSQNGSLSSWDMQSGGLLADVEEAVTSVDSSTDPFKGMSKEFYVMFWSMILYDIHVPFPQYEAEISRLRGSMSSQSAATNLTPSERKKLKEKTTQMIDKLVHEQKDQVAHRKRVYERLEEQKAKFFMTEEVDNQTAVSEVLQKCIIPRALLSPEDALFCAKFMERLHHINTPQFSTVQYYSKATLQLPSIVLCVTEREAGNFGIFLKETMALLLRWYQSSVTYDEEAIHGKSGFSVDLRNPANVLIHRQYKSMYAKCHRSMVQLYSKALSSGEYMPIRNSLIVLTKAIDVFPSGKTAAECLLEIVQVLTEEDREDIKIMARRYFALLTKRKSSLVDDKMLAIGLSAPKKVSDVGSRSSKGSEVSEEPENDSKKKSDKDTSDRDVREGSSRSGRDNAVAGRSDRSRGDNASRDGLLETGEVKSEGSSGRGDRMLPSGPSKLKRRDSERERGEDGLEGDNRRDRHGAGEREQSGTPQRASSVKNTDGGRRSTQDVAEKRDGSSTSRENQRRSRSRSSERRGQRDREREKAVDSKELPGKRDPTEANSRSSSTQDGGQIADNRKRPRVESTEAALRRQLTEKRSQDQRKARDESADSSRSTNDQPSRRDADRTTDRRNEDREATSNSSRPSGGKTDGNNEPAAKKIVSLVSSSRKRDRDAGDSDPQASSDRNGRSSDDNVSSNQDAKRRREGGGGVGGRDDGNNRPGRGDQQQQNRRNGDERRKQQSQQQGRGNNQQKQKNEGGSQQRDPSRSNRPDQRGGGGQNRGNGNDGDNRNGKGGNERRRDSNPNNGGDRRRR